MRTKWKIDELHSNIQFRIKHLVISTVTGSFGKYSAEAETDGDNYEAAKIHFTAEANSVSTGNEQRDAHLKSADFLDAATHPTIDFVSEKMEKTDGENYQLHGLLTMRGTTKPVVLHVEFGGIMKDMYGNLKAGFEVSGTIRRSDFGLSWNALTEAGGMVVSDEVKLAASVQMTKLLEVAAGA